MNNSNAAMAQWGICLQNEARAIWREAQIVRANRLELAEDFEMDLSRSMRDHSEEFISHLSFSRHLRQAKEILSWRSR